MMINGKKDARVDSASVSEIDNLMDNNKNKIMSKEEEVIHFINKFRFKNSQIMHNLLEILPDETKSKDEKKININFQQIQKQNNYQQNILQQMRIYINGVVNQIFPDFTFSPSLQDHFIKRYQKIIDNSDIFSLFTNQSPEFIQNFRDTFQAPYYYGYSIQKVSLDDFQDLIQLILIEEYILLNQKDTNIKRSQNLLIEYDPNFPPEQLGLLSNIFNAACIYIAPVKPQSQQIQISIQQQSQSLNSSQVQQQQQQSGSQQLYNIYILLMYTEVFEGIDTPARMRKTVDGKSLLFMVSKNNTQTQQGFSSTTKNRENQAVIPGKYSKVFHRSTQIPRKSIEKLVKAMDSDGDLKLTAQDIKKFSHKNFITYDDQVYEEMFKEAACKRRVIHQIQYDAPITIEEILGSVTLHMRQNEDKIWVEVERPFRSKWVKFLECIGEKLPVSHDLQKIFFGGIRDLHQLQVETFRPQINKSKSSLKILEVPKKQFTPPFRPEAGIIINNTENVRETVIQNEKEIQQQQQSNQVEPFEKIVNSRFRKQDDLDYPIINFETKNYYLEAERLSKDPKLYIKAAKNPIYSFVPENFNFQLSKKQNSNFFFKTNKKLDKNDQPQQQQTFQNLDTQQIRKYQSLRGSKAFSSNINLGNEYESFSQLAGGPIEDQDLDELDLAESLLKTQTIPVSTLRVGRQFMDQHGNAQLNYNNQGAKSLPVLERINLRESQILQNKKLMIANNQDNKKRQEQGVFTTTFKIEDCKVLKQKLAKLEPVTDSYNPIAQFNFRDIPYVSDKRQMFRNRLKVEPMENPFGISIHDPRPKEALEREQQEQQQKFDKRAGQFDWVNYFPKADLQHNFTDFRRPALFPKGHYEEPSNIIHNLLRGEAQFNQNFKLFHRPLRPIDKNLVIGETPDSKF